MEDYYYPNRYRVNSTKYDYALLKLKDDVKDICQEDLIALNGEYEKLDKEREKNCVFGYPKYYKNNSGKLSAKPMGVVRTGRIIDIRGEQGKIFHKLSTNKGHSGSPIVSIGENSQLSIIGIHRGNQLKVEGNKD